MLRVPGSGRDLFRIKSEGGDVRVVYSPMDALKIAREQPGQRGRVLRHRLRDHGAAERDDGLPGQAARRAELQHAGLARPGAPGHRGDHAVADLPGAGVPGRRPRVQRDGRRASTPTWSSGSRCRSSSPASSRSTSSRASAAPSTSWRTGEALPRQRLRPRRAARGQPGRAGPARRRLRGHRPRLARHRRDPGQRLAAGAEVPRVRRRAPLRRHRTSTPPSRASAAAARCCRASSSRTSARPSARRARRATRSARPWSPARAPARRTTCTGGSSRPRTADGPAGGRVHWLRRRSRRARPSTSRAGPAPSRCATARRS